MSIPADYWNLEYFLCSQLQGTNIFCWATKIVILGSLAGNSSNNAKICLCKVFFFQIKVIAKWKWKLFFFIIEFSIEYIFIIAPYKLSKKENYLGRNINHPLIWFSLINIKKFLFSDLNFLLYTHTHINVLMLSYEITQLIQVWRYCFYEITEKLW